MAAHTFLGLVTAFEHEAILVRRRMHPRHRQMTPVGTLWHGGLHGHDVVLLRGGMGPERAVQATTWLVQSYPLWGVISVGFAGGLQASLDTGDAVLAQMIFSGSVQPAATTLAQTEVVKPNARLVRIAAIAAMRAALVTHCGSLVSVAEVVSYAAAKARLGQCSGALAVDMESYSVGQIAAAHNLPFVTLRTIFDTHADDVPLQVERFATPDGVLQSRRVVWCLIRQPRLLSRMLPLWRKARIAGKHLEVWLQHFLPLLGESGMRGD
jgi:adenosylhomocysteine nucleosidase